MQPGFCSVFLTVVLTTTYGNRWGGGWGGGNRWKHGNHNNNINEWRHNGFNPHGFHTAHQNGENDNFNGHNKPDSSWGQQQQHNNDNFQHSGNGRWQKPDHSSSNTLNPDADKGPQISFSNMPAFSKCAIPVMGDSSKFQLQCISPEATEHVECSTIGSFLPTGTTALLKCKPPFFSETGDMRVWMCEKGTWKGEFKSFRCSYSTPVLVISSNHSKNENRPNNHGGAIPNTGHTTNNNNENKQPTYPWNAKPAQPTPTPVKIVEKTTPRPAPKPAPKPASNKGTDFGSLFPELVGLYEDVGDSVSTTFPISSSKPKATSPPVTIPPQTVPPPKVVQPSFEELLKEWQKTSTTEATTTTTTTTTTKPQLQPPKESSGDWNTFLNPLQSANGSAVTKCPSLSKRTGVHLECVSKSPVPWDPTSLIVSQNDCQLPQPVGTDANYKCQPYFEANPGLTIQYRKCKDDGTWTGGDSGFSCALECGKSNPVGKTPFITHGEPTYKAQWPWHAALFFREVRGDNPNQHEYICGGTLISQKAILTAAHCVTESSSKSVKSLSDFRIDLGRYQLSVDDEYIQRFTAETVIPHPSYNPFIYDSDIAIIILKTRVAIGFHVRPICYPQTQNSAFEDLHLSDGSLGTAVGFGKNENGNLADILQMARLKVISQQECADSFADTNSGAALTKSTTFCAGLRNGTNVCSGDSGGGIYFPTDAAGSSRWFLQGLVSVGIQNGEKKCDPTRNSVFTRISPYADWVIRVLSEHDGL